MVLDLSLDPHQPLFGVVGAMSRLREVGFEATELTLDFGEVLVPPRLGRELRGAHRSPGG